MNCKNNASFRQTLLLKIFSYENKQPTGTIHAVGIGIIYTFKNLTQLLMYIDNLDNLDTDQKPTKADIFELARKQSKKSIADFKIDIFFKKFGAWQGEMTCINSKKTGAFRSVIEMAIMLDCELENALASNHRKEADI